MAGRTVVVAGCVAAGLVTTLVALSLAGLAAPTAAYEEITVTDGGTLAGVVRFSGAPPVQPPLHVNKNRDVCGETKPSEALLVGRDGGVASAVVMIEGVTKGKKPSREVIVDNHTCLFVAHVTAVTPGEHVKVKNSDPILHSTHFVAHPGGFNLALPNKGQEIDVSKRLRKPAVLHLVCDAHPHMSGWVIVHDSPYVAVTDERGAFKIAGVPPGSYKVTMWHEGFRAKGVDKDGRPLYESPHTISRDVTIAPKATATVDFELK